MYVILIKGQLGRCTHFIDPSLGEEQIAALQDKLNAEDAEVERLKGIAEDKVPETMNLGVENIWLQKLEGDSQVFTKDEGNLVYGVTVLRNIYWPGWVTIGYVMKYFIQKSGYCNFYLGNGLKAIQPSWNEYTNPDIEVEGNDCKEEDEPNPKEEPKAVEENPKEG